MSILNVESPSKGGAKDPNDSRTDPGFKGRVEAGVKSATKPANDGWPTPVNLFTDQIAPPFPLESLPKQFQVFALEENASSGFDSGAYGFCLLGVAGDLIDHRAKIRISASMTQPPNTWLGLVGRSGFGKSPTMEAAVKFAREIDDKKIHESQRNYAKYKERKKQLTKGEDEPETPLWKQRIAQDTTTEALAALLEQNPEGIVLLQDEMTEFIGRMDAYSGSGKDRGAYLRAYGGGQHIVNRRHSQPLVLDNFSVGIITGIQPEKLANLFKKSGGGSDGLYQRFMMYAMRPSRDVDYTALKSAFTDQNVRGIFEQLQQWTDDGTFKNTGAALSGDARQEMQRYHNDIRGLVSRTAAKRFAEHLDKFPGMLARVTFILHCIECAIAYEYSREVSAEIFIKAKNIMKVLYRHSESIYESLDAVDAGTHDLLSSAAEAILSKGWREFKRGDLTRNATYWRKADKHVSESAIDYLIELGWIRDITPIPIPGQRGRRSDGLFMVNPAVHTTFTTHVERIVKDRKARYEAIQVVAAERTSSRNNEQYSNMTLVE